MTQWARKLKPVSTEQQHPAVLTSLAKPQHSPVYRCRGDSPPPSPAPHAFLEVFLPLSVTFPLLQTGPRFKGPLTWNPRHDSPGHERNSVLALQVDVSEQLPCPTILWRSQTNTVTAKDVSELWSHPGHFHPLSLLWRNTPNTELTDSGLSLNTCVLLPLWNVFLYSAVYLRLILWIVDGSPSQKSYYKITYKIYLIFMLLLYIPCGDK